MSKLNDHGNLVGFLSAFAVLFALCSADLAAQTSILQETTEQASSSLAQAETTKNVSHGEANLTKLRQSALPKTHLRVPTFPTMPFQQTGFSFSDSGITKTKTNLQEDDATPDLTEAADEAQDDDNVDVNPFGPPGASEDLKDDQDSQSDQMDNESKGDEPTVEGVTENLSDESDDDSPDVGDEEKNNLLDSIPLANLRGGISNYSMQRAVQKRDIADPIASVAMSALPAPHVYRYGQSMVYKTWDSPNVYYRALHFEEEGLERYGHHAGHHLQPAVSGLRFISNVAFLPYKRATTGRCDCEFGLGYHRPGNCNPAYWNRLEKSKSGFAAQALTAGAVFTLL